MPVALMEIRQPAGLLAAASVGACNGGQIAKVAASHQRR
jgi:hypothetical protein